MLKKSIQNVAIVIALTGYLFAQQTADVIYTNGKIYTVNDKEKWAESVAVEKGKFIGVGSNKDTLTFKGKNTKVIDLKGKFVMPGLIDEHIHPDMGADNYLNIFLMATDSWETVTKKIQSYRKKNPDKKWLYGGNLNWLADDNAVIAGTDIPSNKKSLDAIVSDRPVALWDQGAHAMLLNSMALKELGFDRNTPNPAGGIIVKDAKGEPTGVIRETVTTQVLNALDNFSPEVWTEKGMRVFLNEMSSYGVTAMNDAYGSYKNLDAYHRLEKQGVLNHYMHVSIATPIEFNDTEKKKAQKVLIKTRKNYASKLIYPEAVKYVMDGSAGGQTAVMLEPFIGTKHRGHFRDDINAVRDEMKQYAQEGLAFKAHAIGDRSIRTMLDIYETLPRREKGTLHSIAHGTFIDPEDIPRFAELGVVYEASPALWFPNDGETVIRKDIGDRTDHLWPIKELVRTGALVTYGSDWTVSLSPNPWTGIETMVTREKPGGSKKTLGLKHAVELSTVVKIFTLNGAKAMGLADQTGSIEVGKYADMIILDRNIFTSELRKIHETKVLQTIFHGKLIPEWKKQNGS